MASEELTDQQIMKKYLDIITADYRSCYTGLDMLKEGYNKGTLNDMAKVFKEFFVGVAALGIIDFNEISTLRPNLLASEDIFYQYEGEMIVMPTETFHKDLCFYQDPLQEDEEPRNIHLKVNPGLHCKVQATNTKMTIEVFGSSRLECYSSGQSEITIILHGSASALMINVDNINPVTIENKGLGSYHYKEVQFNT